MEEKNKSTMASFDSEFAVCYASVPLNCKSFVGNCVSMYIKLMMIIEIVCLEWFQNEKRRQDCKSMEIERYPLYLVAFGKN
jgi:hypothetical protein